jgi:putative membrane-bound dehydrogenase-like protein
MSTAALAQEPAPATSLKLVPSQGVPYLQVAEGFEIDLVVSEPVVEKPLYMQFDARGRLWVVEYRQYPWPAGLKLLSRDNVWRNVYDKVPPPPPHAANSKYRGADRVSIHTDADRDGTFESHRVFVDGLSLATAALPMNGGVYVLNPPYLLFYADVDGDDRPDSETPRILLSGFGIEDSHSLANSLRRGVDGWIYATQGSTVSAAVVRHGPDNQPLAGEKPVRSLGQNLWRYHPGRHVYEIVAEGGGNAFGVESDAEGNLISGHNGGDTRGFHYTPGAFHRKTFDKHGDLSHPFAFGALPAMAHHRADRFTHTFVRYEASELDQGSEINGSDVNGAANDGLRGKILAVSPIRHEVVLADMERSGSTFRTRDAGVFVSPLPGDRPDWFSPVDIQLGPDGCVYIADWYSEQCNHYRNHEGKTTPGFGRIYRVRCANRPAPPLPDLAGWSNDRLLEIGLADPNRAVRRLAAGLIEDRLAPRATDDSATVEQRALRRAAAFGPLLSEATDDGFAGSVEAYAALTGLGAVDVDVIRAALRHTRPEMRRAALRTLADRGDVPSSVEEEVLALVRPDQTLSVLVELAAAARRWPGPLGRRVAAELIDHPPTTYDATLAAQVWWLVERHVATGTDVAVLMKSSRFADSAAWNITGIAIQPKEDASLPGLLLRRAIARGTDDDREIAERILTDVPDEALRGMRLSESFVTPAGAEFLGRLRPETRRRLASAQPALELFLRLREGDGAAIARALKDVFDNAASIPRRIAMTESLAAAKPNLSQGDRTRLWELAIGDPSEALGVAVLGLLHATSPHEQDAPEEVLVRLDKVHGARKDTLLRWLAERPASAKSLVKHLGKSRAGSNNDKGTTLADVPPEVVEQMRRHADAELMAAVDGLFPRLPVSKEARERRIEQVASLLATGGGKPLAGRDIYREKAACGRCHSLFGEGGRVGPDLTPHDRRDARTLLLAIVHPSAEIREGFSGMAIETVDGRLVTGLKVADTAAGITVRGSDGTDTTVPRAEIESAEPLAQSLMPENLLDALSEQELRDLFAYLMSTTPPK